MRSYNDMVILKPREDLDRKWASDTIFAPDSALLGASSLQIGERRDTAAVCEVVHIGPGSEECPDTSAVRVGDVCVLPLYGASKVLIISGEPHLLVRFRGLAGVIRGLGTPDESLEAVNDYVLTRQDRDAFERVWNGGLIMHDNHISDGAPCDGGGDGIVRVCLERVVSAGGGHWETDGSGKVKLDKRLWAPHQTKGDLVVLNPLASIRFRRHGQWFRLTPFEDVQVSVDDT